MCVVKCFPQAHNFRTVSTASCLLACDRRGVSVTFSVASQVMQRALSMYNYPLSSLLRYGARRGAEPLRRARRVCVVVVDSSLDAYEIRH